MTAGSQSLRIGEVARGAGVNIQTLRYYERRRLVRPPQRELNGYRRYDAESVKEKRMEMVGSSSRKWSVARSLAGVLLAASSFVFGACKALCANEGETVGWQ